MRLPEFLGKNPLNFIFLVIFAAIKNSGGMGGKMVDLRKIPTIHKRSSTREVFEVLALCYSWNFSKVIDGLTTSRVAISTNHLNCWLQIIPLLNTMSNRVKRKTQIKGKFMKLYRLNLETSLCRTGRNGHVNVGEGKMFSNVYSQAVSGEFSTCSLFHIQPLFNSDLT